MVREPPEAACGFGLGPRCNPLAKQVLHSLNVSLPLLPSSSCSRFDEAVPEAEKEQVSRGGGRLVRATTWPVLQRLCFLMHH